MKLIWINLIAIIIAISSLVVERPAVEADFSLPASLTQFSHLQADSLRNDSQKNESKSHQIAQDFIAIVVIADSLDANQGLIHYLPFYDLNRHKDYFLLI